MNAASATRGRLSLRSGQVDVWLTSLADVDDDRQLGYLELLSEQERAKWRRFVVRNARLQYLVTRALVRTTLSKYTGVPAQIWQFETNRYGRPHVWEPQASRDIRFNLSNTTGLVACAVSIDCEVGVDVESASRPLDLDALAPSVFAPAELADYRRAPPKDRRNRFFSYWTLKEAYIKARGMGLSLPLDAFWFELSGLSPRLNVTDRCPDDALQRWRFYQYMPTGEHRMAVAVAPPLGLEPTVHLHWVVPGSVNAEFASRR